MFVISSQLSSEWRFMDPAFFHLVALPLSPGSFQSLWLVFINLKRERTWNFICRVFYWPCLESSTHHFIHFQQLKLSYIPRLIAKDHEKSCLAACQGKRRNKFSDQLPISSTVYFLFFRFVSFFSLHVKYTYDPLLGKDKSKSHSATRSKNRIPLVMHNLPSELYAALSWSIYEQKDN